MSERTLPIAVHLVWFLTIYFSAVFATNVPNDTDRFNVELRIGSEHFLYPNPPGTKTICAGDTVLVECIANPFPEGQPSRAVPKPLYSLIDYNPNGSQILAGSNDYPINIFDATKKSFVVVYDESNNGKTINYTCVYGKPRSLYDRLQIEWCRETRRIPMRPPPEECFFRDDLIVSVKYQRCTWDETVNQTVWEGDDVTLRCNGALDSASVRWYFDGNSNANFAREPTLKLAGVSSSQSGVYTCFSYNPATGYYNKHNIDLEVLPRVTLPTLLTELSAEEQPDGVVISWKSKVPYRDNGGRLRPSRFDVTNTVWYAPISDKRDFVGTLQLNWISVNTTCTNNLTLSNLEPSDLYAILVTTSYGKNAHALSFNSLLVKLNNISEVINVERNVGDRLDIPCGPESFRHLFSQNHHIRRRCVDGNGNQTEKMMTSRDALALMLPEHACSYYCNGLISVYGPAGQFIVVDFSFTANLTLKAPASNLPTLENVRCSGGDTSSFSVSWSTAQNSDETGVNVTLVLVDNKQEQKVFSTSVASMSFKFDRLISSSSYIVVVFAQRDNAQGRPIVRSCSTTVDVMEHFH